MSILSEAWRRAHGEGSQWARTLGAPTATLSRRPPLLPWLLCGLLAALAAGLAVYVWLDHGLMTRDAPPPSSATTALLGAKRTHAVLTSPSPKLVKAPALVQVPPPRTAPARVVPAPQQAAVEPKAPAQQPAEQPEEDRASRAAQGSEAASNPPASSAPIALADVPVEVREAFPALDIVAHVWNAAPAARFVVSGGREFRPGDEIAPGVRLIEITRTGEIVTFRGYRIALP